MTFEEILTKSQPELLKYLNKYLGENGYLNNILCTEDYLFAKGEIPIMLVAHLDTVHKNKLTHIFWDKEKNVIWSPEGIGGDDRCGVYIILKLIEEYKPYILFTTDEEKGGIGAGVFCEQFQMNLYDDIKYIIEVDRRGKEDAVFYKCGNKDFQEYVTSFGFKTAYGTFSDISVLSPNFDIASVNLSSGYFNEHTLQEYINLNYMYNTMNKIKTMLADEENAPYFDYQEKVCNYYSTQQNTKKDNKKDNKKDEKNVVDPYDQKYWEMYDDWFRLDDKAFKTKYDVEKPKLADDVWDL